MADPIETRRAATARPAVGAQEPETGWGLAAALVLLALLVGLVASRQQPLPPKPADAPVGEFSAGRARQVLQELLGDGRPHPVGSPANAAVRDRIVAHLRGLGYAPEVQKGFACGPRNGACGAVDNVVARLDGTAHDGAVLLLSHYDSVPAGTGAADDMTGVAAVLEVARVLKAGPPPRNTVLFLLDDGEEAGLLGAAAFVEASPLAAQVKAVVNLEARGTAGPSLMFETSGDDLWTVPLFAAGATRPITSSVYATIYELMPNDTDLTVFKRRGVAGLNFAFVRHPAHYHTPLDNLADASPASLQHHGDNALAAVRGLAQADLTAPVRGRAVFFDLLGTGVVRWRRSSTLWLALLALALVAAATVLAFRRGAATAGGLALGFLAFLLAIVFTAAVAFGLGTVAGASPVPWVAHPLPVVAAFWLLALAVGGFAAAAFARRAGFGGLWTGAWLGWALLSLVLSLLPALTGLSYLFLVPTLVAGLAGLAFLGRGSAAGNAAVLLPALVAAVLWYPLILPLYDGLGAAALMPIAVLVAILLTSIAPLYATAAPGLRRALPIVAIVLAVLGVGAAVAASPYSPESPEPITVQLYQDADSGEAHWILHSPPPVPPALLAAAAFGRQPEKPFPWSPQFQRSLMAPAPPLAAAPPPALTVLADTREGTKRRLRLRLTSPRGAGTGFVYIPAAAQVEAVAVEGHTTTTPQSLARGKEWGWYSQAVFGLPAPGVELEVVLGDAGPHDWYVADRSSGLPPTGDALLRARPATAAPVQDGDTTLVSRKVTL